MDPAPGRIGFMSTQRRENRWQRRSCTAFAGAPEQTAPLARQGRADASGGTAPPGNFHLTDIYLSLWSLAWLATNSLQSDRRTTKLVRIVPLEIRRGSPPFIRAVRSPGRPIGTSASARSSLSFIPFPSGSFGFPSSLPQIPAGRRRWAERYDGKRDLHLQHAA